MTGDGALKMVWRRQAIVDISRDFLDTNGVRQTTTVTVKAAAGRGENYFAAPAGCSPGSLKDAWLEILADLNIASQKGLVERFDSTIGAGYGADAFRRQISGHPRRGHGGETAGCWKGTRPPAPS